MTPRKGHPLTWAVGSGTQGMSLCNLGGGILGGIPSPSPLGLPATRGLHGAVGPLPAPTCLGVRGQSHGLGGQGRQKEGRGCRNRAQGEQEGNTEQQKPEPEEPAGSNGLVPITAPTLLGPRPYRGVQRLGQPGLRARITLLSQGVGHTWGSGHPSHAWPRTLSVKSAPGSAPQGGRIWLHPWPCPPVPGWGPGVLPAPSCPAPVQHSQRSSLPSQPRANSHGSWLEAGQPHAPAVGTGRACPAPGQCPLPAWQPEGATQASNAAAS